MGWLIAYDISSPARWRRVHARVCETAARVQYSLFYTNISGGGVNRLIGDLEGLIDPVEDDLRFYHLGPRARIVLRGRPLVPEGVYAGMLQDLIDRAGTGRAGGG